MDEIWLFAGRDAPRFLRSMSNTDPELSKNVMFWLGQSNDPRAIALFGEILAKQ